MNDEYAGTGSASDYEFDPRPQQRPICIDCYIEKAANGECFCG